MMDWLIKKRISVGVILAIIVAIIMVIRALLGKRSRGSKEIRHDKHVACSGNGAISAGGPP